MERFESYVKGLTFKGLGVVLHPNGQVFFVRGAWPGDEGLFEVEKVEKNYGYARIVELTRKSSARRDPPCPHMGFEEGKCGGCPWMIAEYSQQLHEKNKLVEQLLDRAMIRTDMTQIYPIIGSSNEFFYRNRAQLKTNGSAVGFVSQHSNSLASIEDCLVLSEPNRKTLNKIKSMLPNSEWVPQNKWNWNFIDLDEDFTEIEINARRPFKQANNEQNDRMKSWVKERIKRLSTDLHVLELFCGSGNFTKVFSEVGFKKIFAVEVSEAAILKLKQENLLGVEASQEDIYKESSWKRIKNKMSDPQVLFLDPPREGFSQIGDFIKKFPSIQNIFYVSCDLSTYINDVKKLRGQGFELVEIQPVDQFPQTPHIEILSYLKKA